MKLYIKLLLNDFKGQMMYRNVFFIQILSSLSYFVLMIISTLIMISRFHSIQGFTLDEIIFNSGIMFICYGVSSTIMRGFDQFSYLISQGQFDRMLLRPIHLFYQVSTSSTQISMLFTALQGVIMLVYSLNRLPITIGILEVLVISLMIICGTLLFCLLMIVFASLTFFTTQGLEIMNLFTNGGLEFGKYPMGVYGASILKITTYLVPFALVQYYPILYLMNKSNQVWYGFTPILVILFIVPTMILWRVGLKHYQSIGN